MRKIAIFFFFALAVGQYLQGQNQGKKLLFFDSGSHDLSPENETILRDLIEGNEIPAKARVEIRGYADNVGSAELNRELSRKRAQAVADLLRSMDREVVLIEGDGEANPIASNDHAEGRQKNRRVELRWTPANTGVGGTFLIIKEDELMMPNIDPAAMGMKEEKKPEVVHARIPAGGMEIDCGKEYWLECPNGSEIHIFPYTFDCDSSQYWMRVEDYADFETAKENEIPTAAEGEVLESAGMVIMTVTKDKKPLEVLPGDKSIEVFIPSRNFDNEMRLYHAKNWNRRKNLDWKPIDGRMAYNRRRKAYRFRTNLLGGLNIDKPGWRLEGGENLIVGAAIRAPKKMHRNTVIYVVYEDRGTYSKCEKKGKYLVLGNVEPGEKIRLEGSFVAGKYNVKKTIKISGEGSTVRVDGKRCRLLATVNRRAINKTDRWVGNPH